MQKRARVAPYGGNFMLSAGRVHHVPAEELHVNELRQAEKRLIAEIADRRAHLSSIRATLRRAERKRLRVGA